MKKILLRRLSTAAKVNSDREILGVTKNATIKGYNLTIRYHMRISNNI